MIPVPRLRGIALAALLPALAVAPGRLLAEEKPAPESTGRAVQTAAGLDPRGAAHIPIGIPDALDSLKTFVEAEGCFSPGFATYGVYFWIWDPSSGKLGAPTFDGTVVKHGLPDSGVLSPWSQWSFEDFRVRTQVCQVARTTPRGAFQVAGARVRVENRGRKIATVSLYAALRPLGPAGGPVRQLEVGPGGDALLVDGRTALVSEERPFAAGVLPDDTIAAHALRGELPSALAAKSDDGSCSGAIRVDLSIEPGDSRTASFVCPVLPGRRAWRHRWDGTSQWAQLDLAEPNPAEGGVEQLDVGLDSFRKIHANDLFTQARTFWNEFVGKSDLQVPDPRWRECYRALAVHTGLLLNESAPDVAVVNYNVFNRDGVFIVDVLEKIGKTELAARAIDHFLAHPFSGRVDPEADNPGQILWILGEHWRFTRDRKWLERVYPAAAKIAAMIRYLRTTPGPHWIAPERLAFGSELSETERKELPPGRCDGFHPEYTDAFDVAGLREAAVLANAAGKADDAKVWSELASELMRDYDARFGEDLGRQYGSYSVLWPCRLYPLDAGKAHDQFGRVGPQPPQGWRYFALATAHQALLAGRRDTAAGTIAAHLDHPQLKGWFAFDEGGKSGPGGWSHARTTWNSAVAMPHGWATAEMFLLVRDSVVFEDEDRLVLLAGIPEEWFREPRPLRVEGLPTHHGILALTLSHRAPGVVGLSIGRTSNPPGGHALRWPRSIEASFEADGSAVQPQASGDILLPAGSRELQIRFQKQP